MTQHKFPYKWTLKDATFTKDKGTVFSCFACGGGSTMGYKLAGYDVIGCNEIDPRMNAIYVANHHPRYNFLCDIRELVQMNDLPETLYNLDILDGSPPCSSFSAVGARDRDWGKEKHFREGQKAQVLDTLFFDFIALAKKLQPKVVVAENVKGLMLGNAIKYVQKIYSGFEDAGYYVQHFLLDGGNMGIPQRRERVFFLCIRKDIAEPLLDHANLFEMLPKVDMTFNEPQIKFGEIQDGKGYAIKGKMKELWDNKRNGDGNLGDVHLRLYGKDTFFSDRFVYSNDICGTLTGKKDGLVLFDYPTLLSDTEVVSISSFPQDFDFNGQGAHYVCGMSVPPVMMAQVASRIYEQWLSKI